MAWWMWVMLGFGLFAAEALTPGVFFLLFFGLAAVVVGCAAGLGIIQSFQGEWLLFTAVSVVSLLVVRPQLVRRFGETRGGNTSMPDLVGDVAVLTADLEPGGIGKAEMRGTTWNVRSRNSRPLPRGSRCKVERVEGLTLWILPPAGSSHDPA